MIITISFVNSHHLTELQRFCSCEESESDSLSVLSNSLRPRGLYSPWNSPGQNTGVGSRSVLQGIFSTQGSNRGLLHCRQILYQLSHREIPPTLSFVFLITAILTEVRWYLIVVLIPWWLTVLKIFSWTCWPSICLLWKSICADPLPIFQLGCLCLWCWVVWILYIFWILTPYSDISFANIFFFSVSGLFLLLKVSLLCKNFFFLNRNIHSNFIQNSPKVETTPKSINWWMEQNMVYCTIEYYLTTKRKQVLICGTTWMLLKYIKWKKSVIKDQSYDSICMKCSEEVSLHAQETDSRMKSFLF